MLERRHGSLWQRVYDPVHFYIVGFAGDALYELVGHADPDFICRGVGEAIVVIALPAAEPMAMAVESDPGNNEKVDIGLVDHLSGGRRHNAEIVAEHWSTRHILGENERLPRSGDGQYYTFV